MKSSELEKQLRELRKKHGDLDVTGCMLEESVRVISVLDSDGYDIERTYAGQPHEFFLEA